MKKCKIFGREGRLKINGKYWNEIKDTSNLLDENGILKIFLIVGTSSNIRTPPKETSSNKEKNLKIIAHQYFMK